MENIVIKIPSKNWHQALIEFKCVLRMRSSDINERQTGYFSELSRFTDGLSIELVSSD